jgi:hypothetical protein
MSIYLWLKDAQTGPYSTKEIRRQIAEGHISGDTLAWHEGLPGWIRVDLVLAGIPASEASSPTPTVHQQTAKNGATPKIGSGVLNGGAICLVFGLLLIHLSSFLFFIYGPLLLAAFVLSILAMAKERVADGFILLVATLILPVIVLVVSLGGYSKTPSLATTSPGSPAPKYVALDAKMGFQSFKLGTDETALPKDGITPKSMLFQPQGEYYYNVEAINFSKTMELDEVMLTYKQSLLSKITVIAKGHDNCVAFKAALEVAYGTPTENPSSFLSVKADTYEWSGDKCHLTLSITGENATAEFTSPQVDEEVQSRIEAAAKASEENSKEELDKAKANADTKGL